MRIASVQGHHLPTFQATAREREIFWTVTLEQTDPELDVVSEATFVLQSSLRRSRQDVPFDAPRASRREKSTGARDGDENFVVPPSPSPSCRRQSAITSGDAAERVSSVLNHDGVPATPRTKSLFATIGETAYASSNDAFEAINRELHAAGEIRGDGRAAVIAAGASRSKIPNFGDHNR